MTSLKITSQTFALAIFLSAGGASAQDAEWFPQCTSDRCVSQMVASEKDGTRAVASVTLTSLTSDKVIGVAVTLPLGVALEPGAQIVAGEETLALRYKVCLPAGCTAFADLTDEMRVALESVPSLQVRFFGQSDAAARAVELPTAGLASVMSRMTE